MSASVTRSERPNWSPLLDQPAKASVPLVGPTPTASWNNPQALDVFADRQPGESATASDLEKTHAELAKSHDRIAHNNLRSSAKKGIVQKAFSLALSLVGLGVASAITGLTGGAAAPLVVVSAVSVGIAIADLVSAVKNFRNIQQGGNGLAGGDDALNNLGRGIARRLGASEHAQATTGTVLSVAVRLLALGGTALTGLLVPTSHELPLTIVKSVVPSALSALSNAVFFYRGYNDERACVQQSKQHVEQIAALGEASDASLIKLQQRLDSLAQQPCMANLNPQQRQALLDNLVKAKQDLAALVPECSPTEESTKRTQLQSSLSNLAACLELRSTPVTGATTQAQPALHHPETVALFDDREPGESAQLDDPHLVHRRISAALQQDASNSQIKSARAGILKKTFCLAMALGGVIGSAVATAFTAGVAAPALAVALLNLGVSAGDFGCAIKHYQRLKRGEPGLVGGHDALNNLGRLVARKLGVSDKNQARAGSVLSLGVRSLLLVANAISCGVLPAVSGAELNFMASTGLSTAAASSSGLFMFRGYYDQNLWAQQAKEQSERVHTLQQLQAEQQHLEREIERLETSQATAAQLTPEQLTELLPKVVELKSAMTEQTIRALSSGGKRQMDDLALLQRVQPVLLQLNTLLSPATSTPAPGY